MHDFGKRKDGPGGRRGTDRDPVLLNAALMTLSVSKIVTLLDVSKTGTRMRAELPLFIGQEIWLKINPLDIFGTVAWVENNESGIIFDEPLTDEEAASLKARGKLVFCAGLSREEQLGAEDWQRGLMR